MPIPDRDKKLHRTGKASRNLVSDRAVSTTSSTAAVLGNQAVQDGASPATTAQYAPGPVPDEGNYAQLSLSPRYDEAPSGGQHRPDAPGPVPDEDNYAQLSLSPRYDEAPSGGQHRPDAPGPVPDEGNYAQLSLSPRYDEAPSGGQHRPDAPGPVPDEGNYAPIDLKSPEQADRERREANHMARVTREPKPRKRDSS